MKHINFMPVLVFVVVRVFAAALIEMIDMIGSYVVHYHHTSRIFQVEFCVLNVIIEMQIVWCWTSYQFIISSTTRHISSIAREIS